MAAHSIALCFLLQDGRVLLIRKKRGLGAGKITGPGGRIHPGESALAAAVRETKEEVGLTPKTLARAGELDFRFLDGESLHCTVFTARDAQGDLVETDEASPLWVGLSDIPYAEMWADDRQWLPWLLAGRPFQGFFRYDGERLLDGRVEPGTGG